MSRTPLTDEALMRDKKARIVEERRRKRDYERKLSCFWMWPWGHIYDPMPDDVRDRCVVCGKVRERGI